MQFVSVTNRQSARGFFFRHRVLMGEGRTFVQFPSARVVEQFTNSPNRLEIRPTVEKCLEQ